MTANESERSKRHVNGDTQTKIIIETNYMPESKNKFQKIQVYEPAEDSELLLKMALVEVRSTDKVLEMGCGRGVTSSKLRPLAQSLIATDINPHAIKMAKAEGINVIQADLFKGIRSCFDLVIFNPPYLPTGKDDRLKGWLNFAFDGGATGRDTINPFLETLKEHLSPGGRALLLISSLSGPENVKEKAKKEGLRAKTVAKEKYFFEELIVLKLIPERAID